jgi:hydantoinase/carbamoylase family amidase
LGVQAALEVLRTLHENDVETYCPIALIDWTNEEGARFPGAMMCSGVWSTKSSADLESCYKVMDTNGISMREALMDAGYLGDTPCDYRANNLESYFELHIEQGPKLEAANKRIGVVTAVQGMKWFAVRVIGVEGHSGTTPMDRRSDALVTAAKFISGVNDIAKSTSLGVATVGVIWLRFQVELSSSSMFGVLQTRWSRAFVLRFSKASTRYFKGRITQLHTVSSAHGGCRNPFFTQTALKLFGQLPLKR